MIIDKELGWCRPAKDLAKPQSLPKRPTPLSRPSSRPVQPPARAASIPIKRARPEPSPEPEDQPEPLPSPIQDAGAEDLAWFSRPLIPLLTGHIQTLYCQYPS